ncbi:MAG: serine/threonine protein kinase [Planctomycetota bacterium]|nr:MAG: serine/threonine protein kinase [Planctomycetota bacterium]
MGSEVDILFGRIVISNRLATEEQVRHCLSLQERYIREGRRVSIGDIFIQAGILTPQQVEKVLRAQRISLLIRDDTLYGRLAVKNGLVTQSQVNECLQLQKSGGYTKRLGEILVERGYILPQHHRALLQAQQRILQQQRGEQGGAQSSKRGASSSSAESSADALESSLYASQEEGELSYGELFARKALEMGLVSLEKVEECRRICAKMKEMGLEKGLDEVLIEKKYIRGEALQELRRVMPIKSPVEGYICEKVLGEGGMGTVYKAREKGTDQLVALKVLHGNYSEDPAYLRRFLQEAVASIEFDHPHIVRAFDVGVSGENCYYSMEYVDGFAVKDLLDEGALTEEKTLEYAIQIAKALEYAWQKRVVHRDIKPENIMIDKSTGNAKLCDLGIAKCLDKDLSLTQEGMAVGTPYYISPEQAKGAEVDTRSDIYALGTTLFHMVTGRVPYDGNSPTQVLLQHATAPVPMACEYREGVSRRFSEILAKMMAKRKEDRYQTPEELLRDLEQWQAQLKGGVKGEDVSSGGGEGVEVEAEEGLESPIEGYRVYRVLGQGAMGLVYLASLEGESKLLALKVLLPHVAEDKEFLKRFIMEAQASIEFEHPNIVKAYDVGISGDYYYYSMEYVEGKSVKDIMEETEGGYLSEKLAVDIVLQVTEALIYAWQKRVVHRDIKPENIMYTKDKVAKLCDLGIAKQLDSNKNLTAAGMAMGSPYYIAPEQARGQKVDCRTDMYGLGASLFHMVTGTVPFEGYTAAAVMAKHVRSPVPDPRERKPELLPELAELIMRLMQKMPEDRFESPVELKAELERISELL